MKRKLVLVTGILVTVACTMSGTYAYYQDSVTVSNHISTGDVNIGIQEYEKDGDSEKFYQGPADGIVLPSQTISKIPRITNYAETCYIRVKTTYTSEAPELTSAVDDGATTPAPTEPDNSESAQTETPNEEATITPEPTDQPSDTEVPDVDHDSEAEPNTEYILRDEELDGISDAWVQHGEYYYYTQPLQNGESADFFQSVTIPSAWSSRASDRELGLTVTAEAVQAANFTPNFDSESPWGDTEIEQCVHETDNSVTEVTQKYTAISVTYEGAARNLVAAPEDFFQNLQLCRVTLSVTASSFQIRRQQMRNFSSVPKRPVI